MLGAKRKGRAAEAAVTEDVGGMYTRCRKYGLSLIQKPVVSDGVCTLVADGNGRVDGKRELGRAQGREGCSPYLRYLSEVAMDANSGA